MKRIFSLLLFILVSNNAFASLEGEVLICDKDKRGYKFISKDQVIISGVDLIELNKFSINHTYELTENAILIQQPMVELNKKITRPIGWIFRRTLDYVSLDYIDGDWSRKFLWSCEVTSSKQLEVKLKNKLDRLTRSSKN